MLSVNKVYTTLKYYLEEAIETAWGVCSIRESSADSECFIIEKKKQN